MAIRLGIIGLSADQSAWATVAHVGPLKAPPLSDKYTVTALATSSPESAKASAKIHGVSEDKAYHTPEAIASDPDVDMVVVSIKLALHKQMAIPALNAKKQLFVEWPLGNGLKEAEELAALAKKQGVKTAVGLQSRLSPVVVKAKEIIDSGALGRALSTTLIASSSMFQNLPAKYSYMNDPKSEANHITIATAHILDPLCYLLSEFKSLNATAAVTLPTVQITKPDGTATDSVKRNFVDSVCVQGVLESGATVSYALNATTNATPDCLEWIISGEKGALKFQGPSAFMALAQPTLYQSTSKPGEGEGAKWEEVKIAQTSFGGISEVYAAFAEGRKGYVDFEEATKRHKMVEAIYRSIEKGTRESY